MEAHDRLGEIDDGAVDAFWHRFGQAHGATDRAFVEAFQFGDGRAMADSLLGLVCDGSKRATAASVAETDACGAATPAVGDLWVACDGSGRPRAVIETTEVRIGPLSSVDERFAWDEGEGDRTRADWLRSHARYFTRAHARLGLAMNDEIAVVFERFDVVYREDRDSMEAR